jgi:DNA (cytosine-5)-methyltransferase 3A
MENINVLSLFDGMSCGQQALERVGIKVNKYFASEIDKFAIQVTMANYPNTIQLGSVLDVDGYKLPKIDLLMGGSPCQSFSFAGKRKGMSTKCETEILTLEHYLQLKAEGYEFEGQSYLFWEFMRLLNEVKPKYFLLENVEMGEKWEKILSKAIGVNGIHINSALVSAQNRKRIYWTNIGMQPMGLFGYPESIIQQPKDKGTLLKDVLESEVDDKYFLSEKAIGYLQRAKNERVENVKYNDGSDKTSTLTSNYKRGVHNGGETYVVNNTERRDLNRAVEIFLKKSNVQIKKTINKNKFYQNEVKGLDFYNQSKHDKMPTLANPSHGHLGVFSKNVIRRLTPIECERLQTVQDNYTFGVSDYQRYKMLGNGWTIDVICHILSYIK